MKEYGTLENNEKNLEIWENLRKLQYIKRSWKKFKELKKNTKIKKFEETRNIEKLKAIVIPELDRN